MSTETVRAEMDRLSRKASEAYETVRTEAVDPVKKRVDETACSRLDDGKTEVDTSTVSTKALIDAPVYTGQDTISAKSRRS